MKYAMSRLFTRVTNGSSQSWQAVGCAKFALFGLLDSTTCGTIKGGVFVSPPNVQMPLSTPAPAPLPAPSPRAVLRDPCGGDQELLKKYLSASPCVFVRGQGSVQATYAGTNVPVVFTHGSNGGMTTTIAYSHAIGYPGALLNIGITGNAQITLVLPSYSKVNSSQTGVAAGTSDTEYRYKQLVYTNPRRGILGGVLLTYLAPTGSPEVTSGSPAYEFNPLLNLALNKARTIAENLSFPVTNAPVTGSNGETQRQWTFAPQAVTVWRSPGGTLLAAIVQYSFSTNAAVFTINTAQLLARNFQLQATYGGNNSPIDFDNPVENVGHASAIAYHRSFTVGFNYLVGRSEPLSR